MTIYLVILTVILNTGLSEGTSISEETEWKRMSSMGECLAMKRQREFLPPPIPNSTQMFFCTEVEE